MKIKALSPWFGSKRTLAPRIVQALGPHRVYWEPFCGSCAVLLAKPMTSSETVNDFHGELINLARVLRSESHALDLYGRLSRLVVHEDLLIEAAQLWKARGNQPAPESPCVDRAEQFMVCSWFGRNGVAGTSSYNQGFCVRYTANGGNAATRWQSAVASIPAWHERLSGITILNRDAFELIARIEDSTSTAIYCDPPYLVKGAKYVHDFDEMVDWSDDPTDKRSPIRRIDKHELLAKLLVRFKRARVVVSYYEHPRLAELYPGWTKINCPTTKAMVSAGKRDKGHDVKAPEVLLVNEPCEPLFGDFDGR